MKWILQCAAMIAACLSRRWLSIDRTNTCGQLDYSTYLTCFDHYDPLVMNAAWLEYALDKPIAFQCNRTECIIIYLLVFLSREQVCSLYVHIHTWSTVLYYSTSFDMIRYYCVLFYIRNQCFCQCNQLHPNHEHFLLHANRWWIAHSNAYNLKTSQHDQQLTQYHSTFCIYHHSNVRTTISAVVAAFLRSFYGV